MLQGGGIGDSGISGNGVCKAENEEKLSVYDTDWWLAEVAGVIVLVILLLLSMLALLNYYLVVKIKYTAKRFGL